MSPRHMITHVTFSGGTSRFRVSHLESPRSHTSLTTSHFSRQYPRHTSRVPTSHIFCPHQSQISHPQIAYLASRVSQVRQLLFSHLQDACSTGNNRLTVMAENVKRKRSITVRCVCRAKISFFSQ